jgi:hypothetical protein
MVATSACENVLLGALLVVASVAAAGEPPVRLVLVGGAAGDDQSPTLRRLPERLRTLDPRRDVVVFTGNYGDADPPAGADPDRTREAHLLAHVEATRAFKRAGGRVFFLVGPGDAGPGGVEAVRRLQAFLARAYRSTPGEQEEEETGDDPGPEVMPRAGCGDPTLIELGAHLGLLLLDSQWWMEDWANDPQANEGCEVKSRADFDDRLRLVLSSYRTGRLVIASHHPVRSNGELGGSFTAGAHLRPMPLVGTVWVLIRQAGLVEQYQNYPLVRSYVDLVFAGAQRYGAYVFASGHDASLQYLRLDKQAQIISGAGGRKTGPTVDAAPGDFAAPTSGWAEIELDAQGDGQVRLVSGDSGEVLFEGPLPDPATVAPEQTAPPPPLPTGQVRSNFTRHEVWQFGSVMKALLGTFYTDAYGVSLAWDTLDLSTAEGGFTIKAVGGGTQTNSLKLKDAQGGEWVIRGVTKDSSRVLPWPQNQATLLNRLLDHGYTATHPEAALSVAVLSSALGLLHAEPRLLYLPDQEGLGPYRGYLTDEVVLLEQHPKLPKHGRAPVSLVGPDGEGGSKTHFRTTQETWDRLIENPRKHHVDQEELLRARLLDMLMGDWDRHPGQWRFAAIAGADGTRTYRPIARDRDQAFSSYDGLGLFLARIATTTPRTLQPFTADYGAVGWLNHNARNLDASLLNQLPRARWLEIAGDVQAALTDEVLERSLATWHPETYALDGARVLAALRGRRDTLTEAALEYYRLLARNVDILGSSGDDTFDLWLLEGGSVRVAVRGADRHGAPSPPYFDRVFEPAWTRELRLYALEGDDTLVVHGTAATSIQVRFVGGPGQDRVTAVEGQVASPLDARFVRLHDAPDGAEIDPSIAVRDERSALARFNQYDRLENHEQDALTFFPALSVEQDQGLWLGGRLTAIVQGYKRHPFAARHELGAAFATATLGVAVEYRGLFPQSVGQLDQEVLVLVRPTSTRNFFGLTNQFVPDVADRSYYRVRQGWYEVRYGLVDTFQGTWSRAGVEVLAQAVVTDATPGRFVSVSPDAAGGLGPRLFAGARLFAEINTFDNPALPTRGVALHASVEGRFDAIRASDLSVTWKAAAAVALPFDRLRRFVLITRASVEGIVGPHPFYFAPTLGDTNLRAFRLQQLAGDVAFSQTTDLRVDVLRIRSVIPGTIGLNLSLDHGRVFGPTASSLYHLDLGGGIWWCVLDGIGVSLSYYRGIMGGSRFVFALGPLFSRTGF